MLCISVVLLVQSLLMADGGVTALGTNVTLMALVGVVAGWMTFRALVVVLPRVKAAIVPAAAIAALISVPVTAAAFTALFAIGGTAPIEIGKVLTAMVGWHVVIGIGEAVITALVVGSVMAARPDLVYGARHLRATTELEIRKATP